MEMLGRARLAIQPGTEVDSPILNDFGDHILFVTGKARFAQLRLKPEDLAEELKGKVPEVHMVGDCVSPRRINQAVATIGPLA